MLAVAQSIISEAENLPPDASLEQVLHHLRCLSVDDFGYLLLTRPNPDYPRISRLLPRMTSVETQRSWTGADGPALLRQTLNFVRIVSDTYRAVTGKALVGKTVLDYGCGYGRILRLMYFYTDPAKIYGCDPWDESLRLCRHDRILGQLAESDYFPTELPFSDVQFDLIYCFSVFTH